jgi:hypothetical protein
MNKKSLFLLVAMGLVSISCLKAPEGGFVDWLGTKLGLKPKTQEPRDTKPIDDDFSGREDLRTIPSGSTGGKGGSTGPRGKTGITTSTMGKTQGTRGSGSTGTVAGDTGFTDVTFRDQQAIENVGRGPRFVRPNREVLLSRSQEEKAKTARFTIESFKEQLLEDPRSGGAQGGLGKTFFAELAQFRKSNREAYDKINKIMESFYKRAETGEVKPKDIDPAVEEIREIVIKIRRAQQKAQANSIADKYGIGTRSSEK